MKKKREANFGFFFLGSRIFLLSFLTHSLSFLKCIVAIVVEENVWLWNAFIQKIFNHLLIFNRNLNLGYSICCCVCKHGWIWALEKHFYFSLPFFFVSLNYPFVSSSHDLSLLQQVYTQLNTISHYFTTFSEILSLQSRAKLIIIYLILSPRSAFLNCSRAKKLMKTSARQ